MNQASANHTLYNCCKHAQPPDWSKYDAVEMRPVMIETEGPDEQHCVVLSYAEKHLADFWSVYARTHQGCWEAVTDVSTARLAWYIAGLFATENDLELMLRDQ